MNAQSSNENIASVWAESRRRLILYLCSCSLAVAFAVIGLHTRFVLEPSPGQVLLIVSMVVVSAYVLAVLLLRPKAKPPRLLFTVSSIVHPWAAVITTGGTDSPLIGFALGSSMLAALLFSIRSVTIVTIVNSVFLGVVAWLTLSGRLGGPIGPDESARLMAIASADWLLLMVIAIGAAFLLHFQGLEALTARRMAHTAQAASTRFAAFSEVASDWVWEIDANGICQFVGGRFIRKLGRPEDYFIGRPYLKIVRLVGDARIEFRKVMAKTCDFQALRAIARGVDGQTHTLELSGSPYFDEVTGELLGFRGVGVDITDRLEAERRINYLARYDDLTGLLNRAAIHDALVALEDAGETATMLLIDLDGFKAVNDTYGHSTGDELLKIVAARLKTQVRGTDLIGRLGGDEFVIIQRNRGAVGRAPADALAERILEAIAAPAMCGRFEVSVSGSVGIANMPEHAAGREHLFVVSDLALYSAKEAGRSQAVWYSPNMEVGLHQRLSLEKDLRQAIEMGELDVAFQPQLRADDGGLVGFEALARWTHPQRGIIPPDTFIAIAEGCGLIMDLERLILHRASGIAAQWPMVPGAGSPPRLAVNISAAQFNRGCLIERVTEILEDTKLPAERLEIEITESGLMSDTERAVSALQALHDMGISVAVDDFGTGYSSLSYLQRFPLSRLKIDRSFVQGLGEETKDQTIATAIVHLGHGLGLSVLAEGVETAAQETVLRDLGCDELQGYRYGRPMSAAGALSTILSTGAVEQNNASAANRRQTA